MNYFIKAKLVSLKRINVLIFAEATLPNNIVIKLFKDDVEQPRPRIVRKTSNGNLYIYDLEINETYDFSSRYSISIMDYAFERVDVSNATEFPEFDTLFGYKGDDLGCTYSKEKSVFAVWSPLATAVTLKMEQDNGSFKTYRMTRDEHGVYRITMPGDWLNRKYHYRVEENGVKRETNDIYGKAVSLNSEYSVVIDQDKIYDFDYVNATSENTLLKSIIYEVSVRDFTEGNGTDIVNKGKYLGFVEPGRKTKGKNPAGLDYLKNLGITHVQLNPILDFRGVDDIKVKESYNWGYDPISFFAIEGSYSSNPEDAMSRIKEFREMVNELHKNNIRVVVDVVYNHIYEYQNSVLEKTTPRYFFRRRKNGEISGCSGCGNDINSNRVMARKLIIDSAKYLVKAFNIDGFRFDLMGLIDIETLKELEIETRKIKDDLIFYGEGWDMPIDIPHSEKACLTNCDSLPDYGFFNDVYRDVIKGPTFADKINEKGYINGNIDYHFGADYAFHATVVNRSYIPRFKKAHQSINYIECHDNNTLFDKLCLSNSEEEENILLARVKTANAFLMHSFGVPFVHMGQEIGQSKAGHPNTYNVVKINNMRWDLVDQRFEMVNFFKRLATLRKSELPHLLLDDPKLINEVFTTTQWDNGLLCLYSENKELLKLYDKMMILINVTNHDLTYQDDDYWSVLSLDKKNILQSKYGIVPAHWVTVLVKRNEGGK